VNACNGIGHNFEPVDICLTENYWLKLLERCKRAKQLSVEVVGSQTRIPEDLNKKT